MRDGALTPSQELDEMISRFDIASVKEALLQLPQPSLLSRAFALVSSNAKTQEPDRIQQLDFLTQVTSQFDKESSEEKAYTLLGALEFVQQRWGKFPTHGPLFDLLLKQDDLIQIIAENAEGIQLKDIFNDPNYILHRAEDIFIAFASRNPNLHDLISED